MSSTISDRRAALRTAEDELTKASHLVAEAAEYQEKRRRGAAADADAVSTAFETYFSPGPGPGASGVVEPARRRADLQFLDDPHLKTEAGRTDFFTAAGSYADGSPETPDRVPGLGDLVKDVDAFVNRSGTAEQLAETVDALLGLDDPEMAPHVAEVARFVARAARDWRDRVVGELNNDFPEGTSDAANLSGTDRGAIQEYVESYADGDPIDDLSNETIALLPIRLETRFIGPERDAVEGGTELWVRVYPDAVHNDSHEPQLTDREVRLGWDYWAHLWYATHRNAGALDRTSLETHLPADLGHLVDVLADVDPAAFPDDPRERKDAIKERAWKRLLEALDRERAAYVIHELKPPHWEVLADAETVLPAQPDGGDGDDDPGNDDGPDGGDDGEATPVQPLSFPEPDRKPDAWTRPPYARLLPDRWLAYGVWKHDDKDYREVFLTKSNAIREPLPVGPNPEAIAVAEQYGADEPGAEAETAVGDIEWITAFRRAEQYGMAFRITEEEVFVGGTSDGPIDENEARRALYDLTDGHFEKLVVTGVKSSMDPGETARRLADLFDAHHYTDGIELIRQGTPTNNADVTSGYRSKDDPRESMAVECGTGLVERGDNTDGDRLARALAIDPATVGGDHVFAHVENADNTDGIDAWHMNSALWPGTVGYYLQNMLFPNASGNVGSLLDESGAAEDVWREAGESYDVWHAKMAGWFEAYRRHFVDYVRAQGPLSPFRVNTQPYGLLPVSPMADAREDIWAADTDATREDEDTTGGYTGGGSAGGFLGGLQGGSSGGSLGNVLGGRRGDSTGSSMDLEAIWESSTPEEFRRTVSAREARGSIPDTDLAETYSPAEAAMTFTTEEIATHYDPEAAASVLSTEELRRHYSASELAASDLHLDETRGDGGEVP